MAVEHLTQSALEAAMDAQIAAGSPGVILDVDAPTSGFAFSQARGLFARDQARPLQPQDAFRAASVTKAVTAATAVRLAAEGYWKLDSAIAPFLPRLLLEKLQTLAALPDLEALTFRRLLNHTSGLPDYFFDPVFQARVQAGPERLWYPEELVEAGLIRGSLIFPPGTDFSYGDTGYVLVGIAIERLLRCTLAEAYQALVFQPLGMQSTYLEWREPARGGDLSHHYDGDRDLRYVNLSYDWAGGGLVTTARDLRLFLRGLFHGKLFSHRWLSEITDWQVETRWRSHSSARYIRYGLGLGMNLASGEEIVGVTGVWGAFAYYGLARDVTVTGTLNRVGGDRPALMDAVIHALKL